MLGNPLIKQLFSNYRPYYCSSSNNIIAVMGSDKVDSVAVPGYCENKDKKEKSQCVCGFSFIGLGKAVLDDVSCSDDVDNDDHKPFPVIYLFDSVY